MASMQDIRRRAKSVRNIEQITRAMKMVSAAKLRRAQNTLFAARPYADKMEAVLRRLGGRTDTSLHPLLASREVKRTGFVIITSDRGLAGGFSANVIRTAEQAMKQYPREEIALVTVGRKGRDYFKRRNYEIIGDFVGLGEEIQFSQAHTISESIIALYQGGLLDEIYLVYPQFVSTVTQRQTVTLLLPMQPPAAEKTGAAEAEYLFEPTPEAVLDSLLPRYVATLVYRALLESKASEHGARMAAMDAATKNAEELIKELTLSFNRARQAAITREISEIVGGAEALK